MFFSLCFLLTIASYGFSGVQSNADFDVNDYPDGNGARSLSSGHKDVSFNQRFMPTKRAAIEMVNEGMDKVVSLASALVKGSTPANKRSGVFLAAAKPEVRADIEKKMKEVEQFAEEMKKST